MPFTGLSSPKRRFFVVIAVLAANFVIVGGLVVNYTDYRNDQERDRCDRIVSTRFDARARWDRLADQLVPLVNDQSVVSQMRADTNELLPRLHCVDNIPVPLD